MNRIALSILLLLALLLAPACRDGDGTRILRVSHSLDTRSPVHQALLGLADRLATVSDGRMSVIIYPGGQLGSERECLELLQLGSLDMAKVSSGVIENFVPAMGVFSLPYLFRDSDHYWQVFNGRIGNDILLQGERYWLRGLCYYDAGFRSFFLTNRRVEEPSDLADLKIRVMRSNLSIRTINLLGGNATPLAFGEVYSAMQQGVVDGAENNPPNFYQMRFYEQSRYFVLDEHSAPPDVMVISTHTWNDLSPREQQWLDDAVDESVKLQRRLWSEMTELALQRVTEAGVTVVRPDKAPFQAAVQPIYDDLAGTELGMWAERIRSLPPEPDSTVEVAP